MDKMGSSEKAGNRGKPSTPRDGSAVELVGLSASVVSWLAELHLAGQWKQDGVSGNAKNGEKMTWLEWSEKIKSNFEKHFFVSSDTPDQFVNRRGIYKDTVNSSFKWTDYQLRPNFFVAMVVAPHIFDPEHANQALDLAQDLLVGPLGVKTLDPA